MPPEAFTHGEAGPAWDVYTMGGILFELLTGQPPFAEGGTGVLIHHILTGDRPSVTDLRGDVWPEAAALAERALAVDAAARRAGAADFAAACREALAAVGVEDAAELLSALSKGAGGRRAIAREETTLRSGDAFDLHARQAGCSCGRSGCRRDQHSKLSNVNQWKSRLPPVAAGATRSWPAINTQTDG